MSRKKATLLLVALALVTSQLAFGWGDEGHMAINRAAAQKMPASMPAFMRTPAALDQIVYLGPEPDRWRNKAEASLKYSQEPDHFIDLERTEGIGDLPAGRFLYMQRLYEKRATVKDPAQADLLLPEKVGFQPYIVAEIYGRLKVSFREYRRLKAANLPTDVVEKNAVLYAGWLGHYVGDGSNPLHTTVQYNGWTGPNPNNYTTAKTTHWNFEGTFVSQNIKQLEFASLVKEGTAAPDQWKTYHQYLLKSFGLVEKFYQMEKAGAFNGNGTPEGIAFTRERLAASAQMLVDLWCTAWVESEKPVESPF